ncbi:MAG: ABC transporter permease [Archaeoglobaceae archaeon]|nr:ABC transporter permease [Archaeoglobaceae archaeon]MCX8151978.1 ABC transporter permease [Archaeoglobaceae archaeon]MDW8013367.1 ABC transporter permease [Archaeoglobaceae archaeon]
MRFLSLPAIAYLLVLFYLPFLIVIFYSFGFPNEFTVGNYEIVTNPIFLKVFLNSLLIAALTTVICLILAYPVAYYIALKSEKKNLLLMLVILPFWINFLLRTYALMTILSPLGMMFTFQAVIIGMVYDYLPFMILPLYASLEKINRSQLEASYAFGATPLKTFLKVTLPLSKPGIVAGVILVFVPSLGEFVVPAMLGGTVATVGTLTWDLFLRYHDWWRGSALSVIYIAIVFFSLYLYIKRAGKLEL